MRILLLIFASSQLYAQPIQNVELENYLGTWFEIARTPNDYQDNTVERDGIKYGPCTKTKAEYGQLSSLSVSVKNTCHRVSSSGSEIMETANGVALVVPFTNNTRLRVAFGGVAARFFQRVFAFGGGEYLIYDLGPLNENKQYSWAHYSVIKSIFHRYQKLKVGLSDRFPARSKLRTNQR